MKLIIEKNILKEVRLEGENGVAIPDSVTKIGEQAFSGCEDMTSVIIPESVTKIGIAAFCYCHGLTSVIIPGSVTKICDSAFEDCINLTSVIISDGVTQIGEHAFYNCVSLSSVVIPDSVTVIGEDAFYDCPALETLTFPKGCTEKRRERKSRLEELEGLFSEELKERFTLEEIFQMLIDTVADGEVKIDGEIPSLYVLANEYYVEGKSIEEILDEDSVIESFEFIGIKEPDEDFVKNFIVSTITEEIDMFNDTWKDITGDN